jgi:hypothetical protein
MPKLRLATLRGLTTATAVAFGVNVAFGEGFDPSRSQNVDSHAVAPASAPQPARASSKSRPPRIAPRVVKPLTQAPSHALAPSPDETRFRPSEILIEISARTPAAAIDALRRRHRLDEAETTRITLLGDDFHLWRAADQRTTLTLLNELAREPSILGAAQALDHGTSIAGAIGARGAIEGVAPKARILSVRAFESTPSGPQGTTMSILKGVDWAVRGQARIINMSFAGPPDPDIARVVAAASAKGVILIAAAGNAGPKSPPLYPAADAGVIAVTAIDANDRLFENANRGAYISLTAPGVDVLLPVANGGYDLKTGTSVAAALVSGVAALVLERNPALQPVALKKALTATARVLAPGHETEFGAGLVDAKQALDGDKASAKTQ